MQTIQTFVTAHFGSDLGKFKYSGLGKNITNLDDYEKTIVYKYTESYYETLNEALLTGKTTTFIQNFADFLNFVLDKLPDYVGVVYRGVNLSLIEHQRYIDALNKNTFVEEHAFLSCSKSLLTASLFSKGSTIFQISSNQGKHIEDLSYFGNCNPLNEKEVIFKSSTKFVVLDIETKNNGITYIIMEEL